MINSPQKFSLIERKPKRHTCKFSDPVCLNKKRLFGCICGKGESNTSTSSTTSTISEDNRVVAENGGLSLGRGAGLQIVNEFPEEVGRAFENILSGAGEIISTALDNSGRALDTADNAIDSATAVSKKALDQSTESISSFIDSSTRETEIKETGGVSTTIKDFAPLAIFGIIGLTLINIFKK